MVGQPHGPLGPLKKQTNSTEWKSFAVVKQRDHGEAEMEHIRRTNAEPLVVRRELEGIWVRLVEEFIRGEAEIRRNDRRYPWYCGFSHRSKNMGLFDGVDGWFEIPWQMTKGVAHPSFER